MANRANRVVLLFGFGFGQGGPRFVGFCPRCVRLFALGHMVGRLLGAQGMVQRALICLEGDDAGLV